MAPTPSVADLLLSKLGEAVHKLLNILNSFIFPKSIIPMRGSLLFKMADLVVYSPPGVGKRGGLPLVNKYFVLGFVSP